MVSDKEKVNKNEFIEIEFTGRSNNQIFDTTNPEEAKEIGIDVANIKPLVVSAGNQMLLKGLDEEIIGKEIGKKYSVKLGPEQAFGKRNSSLIKIYSINSFKKNNINPYPGMALQLDNALARVMSVSGGRVSVDFNNPLAGKEVEYNFLVKRKIEKDDEKINALQDFFFKKRFEFSIKDDEKSKKVIFKEDNNEYRENLNFFIKLLGDKFKEMTGFEFEIEGKKEKDDKKIDDGLIEKK